MERIERMVEMRNKGLTLHVIGDAFGISRERVRQLLKRVGYVGKPDLAGQKLTPKRIEAKAQKNRDKVKAWRKANPDKRRVYNRHYQNKRVIKDHDFRLRKSLANTIRMKLRRCDQIKTIKTFELIGCTLPELKRHLEAQFLPGMTWDNWSRTGWHIDHIRPCASFDLTDLDQQRQCFHYTNLQPLWAADNIRKGDKWEVAA